MAAIPRLLNLILSLGYRIPTENIKLDYIKGAIWAVFLGFTILIWPVRSQDKKALLVIWTVKCFVMLGLMLFYEHHYPLDAFGYFAGARYDMSEWVALEISGTSSPVAFIAWLHHHSLFNSYHAAKVSFGMIGLVAIYVFYRAVVSFLRQEKIRLLYILAIFPSILFWSSILGKEPIVLFGIALYCYGTVRWIRESLWQSVIILLIGILIVVAIRSWMGVILSIPLLTVTVICFNKKHMTSKIVTILLLVGIILMCVNNVRTSSGIKSREDVRMVANKKVIDFTRGGSAIGNKKEAKTSSAMPIDTEQVISFNREMDIFYAIPKGMFTALFRPLPGEANNLFGLLAGIESAFLLILFGISMNRMRWRKLLDPVIVWAILLIVLWAAAYGFISYNLGTVCRY